MVDLEGFRFFYEKSKRLNDTRYDIAKNYEGNCFVNPTFARDFERLSDFSENSFAEALGKLCGALSSYCGNFVLTRKAIDRVDGGIEALNENRSRDLIFLKP